MSENGDVPIRLRGVRVHNLKNIDLDLPRNRLIVFTGVSGSGKSSLAFDTLFVEGQRRYVETFSPYIRQFLGRLDKPDADLIDGLPAAIAIAQRVARRSARATVGSVTEIHEALAVLFARAGRVICPDCRVEVKPSEVRDVELAIDGLPAKTRYTVGFPVEIIASTDRDALIASLTEQGFVRIQAGEQTIPLEDVAAVSPEVGEITVIVDRLKRGDENRDRLRDSIETAFVRGLSRCRVQAGETLWTFQRAWRCTRCGRDFLAPDPRLFRTNSPLGACRVCEGFGRTIDLDMERIVPDGSKTLAQGAIAPWTTPSYREWNDNLLAWAPRRSIPVDRPFKLLETAHVQLIVDGDRDFGGLRGFFRWLERKSYKMHVRVFLSRWRRYTTCEACGGARLRPEALAVRLGHWNIAELLTMPITDALAAMKELEHAGAAHAPRRLLQTVIDRLSYLDRIGLGYLTLDRSARTLSAGEARRVSLTSALGSGLVNTLYVLDEPSIGLHPHDIERLIDAIMRLRLAPNSVMVVDHDESVMRAAEMLVDIGPGAGESGGRVVYSGPPAGITEAAGSMTADFLTGRRRVTIPHNRRKPKPERLSLNGACGHNLKDIDVSIPLGVLCVVTGVSGSGKSSLVEETLYPALLRRVRREFLPVLPFRELKGTGALRDVELVDQTPIGRTPRSNPVTYLKAYDEIRKTFAATQEARLRDYGPGRFSFNVAGGRCNACEGNGYLVVDMQFLSDVMMRCPECRGTRFRPETLDVTFRGKNIAEVLDLTAREAFGFFRNRSKIQTRLRPLLEVGLDYLRLGQPANTLSGGEAQRLKLAAHLSAAATEMTKSGRTLFILDEPTTGLHPADIVRLIDCLNALVDRGHSVLVIEHGPELMVSADWVIDLGPEAGQAGGQIVAQGTPEDVAHTDTHTGRVLARALIRP